VIVLNGASVFRNNGTNCATPVRLLSSMLSILEHPADRHIQVAASIISLLNDFLLYHNRPALGFLNPWLYGDGRSGLNDITYGSNPGCNTRGFSAVVGWDPVRFTILVSFHFQFGLTLCSNRSQVSGPLTLKNCRQYLVLLRTLTLTPRLTPPPRQHRSCTVGI
jgi:hypothetical protein